ncbi:MAG: ATP-grasp domain-containing protein [Arthrobacter sp.]|nr:ATP-grasp domain-containing protein [Arthrobacter sp.]
MLPTLAVYPASQLDPRVADEHFAHETAALTRPAPRYDADEERLLPAARDLSGEVLLYRGWILTPDAYARLEAAAVARGARLLVSAEGYAASQFGTGWFEAAAGLTPATEVLKYGATHDDALAAFDRLATAAREREGEPAAVLKGVSKSLKHAWDDAMFIPRRERLAAVLDAFRDEVGEREEPLLLLREFEQWQPGELRVFWAGERPVSIAPHPQTPDAPDPAGLDAMLERLAPVVAGLGAGLVSTDLTRSAVGEWRLVEIGNGQVSEPSVPFASIAHAAGWGELYSA